MSESANIARHLPLMAERQPHRPAIKLPRRHDHTGAIEYLALSFAELDAEVNAWCGRLSHRGVQRGDRVLVMVCQGLPLIAAAFALFKLGAVPVIIDPGMGRKNFLACVARSQPRVLLGIPLAQFTSRIFRPAFKSIALRIRVSGNPTTRLSPNADHSLASVALVASGPTELAAIVFTSGSTGAPKGVCYEHGMFEAQVRLVRECYGIAPGEVDLPMLPIFALFGPALGMTTIVPEIDPSRPAMVDPEKIVRAIRQEKVTNSFGSPTLWRKIFDHCLSRGLTLPSLQRVLCAGAAVPASLWADASRVLPNGRLHSPYGATEALPVATVSSDAMEFNPAWGALVGKPLAENRVKVIATQEGPIASLAQARVLPAGEVGEIIVTGPAVTKKYDHLPAATAQAKIFDAQSGVAVTVWHRLGDAGHLDAQGRLWFAGRVVERIETSHGPLYTEPAEQVFRSHPDVARCALIGLGARGQQEAALVVQPKPAAKPDETRLARELFQYAVQHPHSAMIQKIFFHPDFPVDVRHNAKIHRLALAQWAADRTAFEAKPTTSPSVQTTS